MDVHRILAIDPGTNCGYAWLDITHATGCHVTPLPNQAGVWDLSLKRHEGGGMRYLRVRKYLAEVEPSVVLYEEVASHKGTAAAHVYGGIVSQIQVYCEERDPKIPYTGVPVGTIKKRATGKGNANKDAMMAAATSNFCKNDDPPIEDDNIADALWLLQVGLDEYAHLFV